MCVAMAEDIRAFKEIEVEDEVTSSDVISSPLGLSDVHVTTNPMNLGDLIDMLSEKWIDLDTYYQRSADLWDDVRKSRLIESVLLGLRLPAFYFEEVSRHQWNVIDGLQRCCAIRDFCVTKTLRLKGLEFLDEGKYDGKSFDELSFADRMDIRMLPITAHLLDKDSAGDAKYILFSRLNTGGMPLTPQEVRSAIYHGRAVDAIVEMAECDDFKAATCGKIASRRQEDRDFVSRFAAFYVQGSENYDPDLERFIREAMKALNGVRNRRGIQMSDEDVQRMVTDFKAAMKAARDIFGDDAFRKRYRRDDRRRPINKAYFEVISSVLAKMKNSDRQLLIERKELLQDNLLFLMKNDAFWLSLSQATGTKDNVKCRFAGFRKAVMCTLKNKRMDRGHDTQA